MSESESKIRSVSNSDDHRANQSLQDDDSITQNSPNTLEDPEDLPYESNGLVIDGRSRGLEELYDYETGGHHPVHLGDILHKRYKILHKLGNGGYAVVWLCRDTDSNAPKYVALKIIAAEGSHEECPEKQVLELISLGFEKLDEASLFCLPLDEFEIKGPNGVHFAFVYPVLGPLVSQLYHLIGSEDLGSIHRHVAYQVTKAMAILHSQDMCHGDFRPADILVHVSGLDGLPEHQVLDILGHPQTIEVLTAEKELHTQPGAPQYLVYSIVWEEVTNVKAGLQLMTHDVCVIDFGESYKFSKPPPDLGIPKIYCAPEYILDKAISVASDLWALGCTLFEIRTGRKLFGVFVDEDDELLALIVAILGKLPEPWWSTTWLNRRTLYPDGAGDDYSPQETWPKSLEDTAIWGHAFVDIRKHDVVDPITQEEVEVFVDLLKGLFNYDPEQRVSASEALKHPWFNM